MPSQTLAADQVPDKPIALVLGITGSIGGAIAATLARRGYHVRALRRNTSIFRKAILHPVEWVVGDAMDASALKSAASGATLIVHAVNPPRFMKWREIGIPMLQNTIEAAADSGATVLFPANVYVFCEDDPAIVNELAPRMPTTRKGGVRLEMEKMLAEATRTHGVRVIAIRAGDFFGPDVKSSWFAQAVVKGGRNAKSVKRMTRPGVGHSWAYVPDLAEAFGRVVDVRAELAPFEMVHFGGHYDATGSMLADAVVCELGRPDLQVKSFPWFTVYLAAPFVPFLRETIEMLWLWKHPLRLDNAKLTRLIGEEPHTPLEQAIATTLGPRSVKATEPQVAPSH
jgi:nucleoside-diphosphate-sugar epimerase